jgi:hypothetical protein
MAGKPYQSRLIPFENEIIALRRRKPPMPYSQIAETLREKYQVSVNREAIFKFIKLRMKGYKPCKYDAWNMELKSTSDQPTTEVSLVQKATTVQTPKPAAQDKPEQPTAQPMDSSKPRRFEMQFSETYNLTRLPPEEAAARRKKLEEKENRK